MRIVRTSFNIVLFLALLLASTRAALPARAEDSATNEAPASVAPADPAKVKDREAKDGDSKKKKKKPKPIEHLRIHIEAKRDLAERSIPAVVGRTSPLPFNVEKIPILTESHLDNVLLIDRPDGFQVKVKFNSMGTRLLESYSATAAGRHLCIATDIDGEARWLAAPLLRTRIADGTLAFSTDASREEMERLVTGLNAAVRKEKKKWLK